VAWGVDVGTKEQKGRDCRGKPRVESFADPTQLFPSQLSSGVGLVMRSRLATGEVALETLPTLVVFVLKNFFFEGVTRWANGHARLEHKG
jgi:hypothetical protein